MSSETDIEIFSFTENDREGWTVQDKSDGQDIASITGFDIQVHIDTEKVNTAEKLQEIANEFGGIFQKVFIEGILNNTKT